MAKQEETWEEKRKRLVENTGAATASLTGLRKRSLAELKYVDRHRFNESTTKKRKEKD